MATSTANWVSGKPLCVIQRHYDELKKILAVSPLTLNSLASKYYQANCISLELRAIINQSEGCVGAMILLDHLIMKVEQSSEYLVIIIGIMELEETLQEIAHRMNSHRRAYENIYDENIVAERKASTSRSLPVESMADIDTAVAGAEKLKKSFIYLALSVMNAAIAMNVDVTHIKTMISLVYSDNGRNATPQIKRILADMEIGVTTTDGAIRFMLNKNLADYLTAKTFNFIFRSLLSNNAEAIGHIEKYEQLQNQFIRSTPLQALAIAFKKHPHLCPTVPTDLSAVKFILSESWENRSLYQWNEAMADVEIIPDHLMIADINYDKNMSWIIVTYTILPFFLSTVLKQLADERVTKILANADVSFTVDEDLMKIGLMEMKHVSLITKYAAELVKSYTSQSHSGTEHSMLQPNKVKLVPIPHQPAPAFPEGGFDDEIFLSPPSKDLQCIICFFTVREPHLFTCCGASICKICMLHTNAKAKCPQCHNTDHRLVPDLRTRSQTMSLKVKCTNMGQVNCQWRGELIDYTQHITLKCPNRIVLCQYGCGQYYKAYDVTFHEEEECTKRPYDVIVHYYEEKIQHIDGQLTKCVEDHKLELHTLENNHNDQINTLKKEHDQTLAAMETKHNQLMKSAEEDHKMQMDILKNNHEKQTSTLKKEYNQLENEFSMKVNIMKKKDVEISILNERVSKSLTSDNESETLISSKDEENIEPTDTHPQDDSEIIKEEELKFTENNNTDDGGTLETTPTATNTHKVESLELAAEVQDELSSLSAVSIVDHGNQRDVSVQFDYWIPMKDLLYGATVVDETVFNAHGDKQQTFNWPECGFSLLVPEGALSCTETCPFAIKALISGRFKFPKGFQLISALYPISPGRRFKKKVKISLQHCFLIERKDQLKNLCFIKAHATSDHNDPYEFKCVRGGVFTVGSQYCELWQKDFSIYAAGVCTNCNDKEDTSTEDEDKEPSEGENSTDHEENEFGIPVDTSRIMFEQRSSKAEECVNHPLQYIAHFFCDHKMNNEWFMQLVATKFLDVHIKYVTNEFRDKELVESFMFHFLDPIDLITNNTAITLIFPPEQTKSLAKGWFVKPMSIPCSIPKKEIDTSDSLAQIHIPMRQVSVFAEGETPSPHMVYTVPVEGIKEEKSITIIRHAENKESNSKSEKYSSSWLILVAVSFALFAVLFGSYFFPSTSKHSIPSDVPLSQTSNHMLDTKDFIREDEVIQIWRKLPLADKLEAFCLGLGLDSSSCREIRETNSGKYEVQRSDLLHLWSSTKDMTWCDMVKALDGTKYCNKAKLFANRHGCETFLKNC